jgi:hypothetical protein
LQRPERVACGIANLRRNIEHPVLSALPARAHAGDVIENRCRAFRECFGLVKSFSLA